MEKVLEGSIERFEVPDVLTFLNMGRRSGLLAMERADQETKLFIRDGSPVFATSSRDDLRLGNMLIRWARSPRTTSTRRSAPTAAAASASARPCWRRRSSPKPSWRPS